MGSLVIRKYPTRCLDARTLAALTNGTIPLDELPHIQKHLPRCSKCVAAVAAGSRRRARCSRTPQSGDFLRVCVESRRGRLLRGLAVTLSLLALGSSATCWYLDPNGAQGSLSGRASPSGLMRGGTGAIEGAGTREWLR